MKNVPLVASCLGVILSSLTLARPQQRPPATPLIAHDPYFSVWSTTDKLTGSDTSHWTGAPQPIAGIVRIDGKPFRFMGAHPDTIPAVAQTGSSVTPTHTNYEFQEGGVAIKMSFFTPAMMNDLDLLSRPVTYLAWTIQATDGAAHQVAILLDIDPLIAVNDRGEDVVSLRNQTNLLNVLSVGSRDQKILNRSGDDLRIDWGYFRLAVPGMRTRRWRSNPIRPQRSPPRANSPQAIPLPCLSLPAGKARTLPQLWISARSVQAPSPVTSCFPIPRATPFNISSGISGHTGNATVCPWRRCLTRLRSNTRPWKPGAKSLIPN